MRDLTCQVLIIGAGPGGYVCAIRAGQLGLDTVVVEKEAPGGTCLNVGCIPSKALIHTADEFFRMAGAAEGPLGISSSDVTLDLGKTQEWKDGVVQRLTGGVAGLMKAAGVRHVAGRARVEDGKTVVVEGEDGPLRIRCESLVIATGAAPVEVPALPFGGQVITSTEALELREVPERLAMVGGGYIGLEIGTAFAKMGSKVAVVEAEKRILPQYDAALTKPVAARLEALGVELHLEATATGLSEAGALMVETAGNVTELPADKVLVTVGRRPVLDGFGLGDLGLSRDGPFLRIDEVCATSMRGVYAIGDVTGAPMLAHRAIAQGKLVAEHLAGHSVGWDKRAVAAVCFTDPEVVVVGALPGEVEGAEVSQFPFQANGRALTMERTDGFVRVVHAPDTGLVLGLQAVGAGVSELAGEFALALEMAATLTDIAETIHAHPTLGETVQEAAMGGLGAALHI
ncbi:dihydrolipoamide dehydrogenase [Salinihabitans flavidus]|uniref:Dihydrolipoyl dehydrogenase n=1 Tax=Salinihabitans flavidus TaxID=569882 RepID=A0A1H8SY70_9RHOB|nr:dihydrolipoyl dehydrogenase [Salinihabitans flavidus]SEO83661.1 dihydrolipoamide dehydrogenase [Salinihabitans flavidus]